MKLVHQFFFSRQQRYQQKLYMSGYFFKKKGRLQKLFVTEEIRIMLQTEIICFKYKMPSISFFKYLKDDCICSCI